MAQGPSDSRPQPKRLGFFERYLTVWVLLCMVVGVLLGKMSPGLTSSLIILAAAPCTAMLFVWSYSGRGLANATG